MKNKRWVWIFSCLMVWGCEDFFEKDLSGKQPELIAPADNAETFSGDQLFLWKELPGGKVYRLLIVTPSFENPALCILDTLVNTCLFSYSLKAGEYAWGIRAENFAWKGDFCIRNLIVLSQSSEP